MKLVINTKGEIVLTTTSSTVLREESDESDLSLELSQKQRDQEPQRLTYRQQMQAMNIEMLMAAADIDPTKQLPFFVPGTSDQINDPPLLSSTKQIW